MAVIPVSSIGASAVQITSTATPLRTGLLVIADPANTKPVFVGNGSGVTAGTNSLSGHPILPGGAIFLSAEFLYTSGTGQGDASNAYAIAASGSNTLYCIPDGNKEDYEAGLAVGATQGVDLTKVAGATISQGHGTAATAIRVELPTDGTGLVTADMVKVGGTAFALGQALATASLPVVLTAAQLASLTAPAVAGDTAAAASDAGNPVKIGGVGKTANPTAVTDGQRVNGLFDKLGKQICVGAIRDLKGVQKTTITSSTSETTIVTAVASTFLDVYGLIIANTSATACNVTIKDATSGTTRAIIAVPAGETRGFMLPVDSAMPQAAVNNNWTATCSASVASIEITALYVKNL